MGLSPGTQPVLRPWTNRVQAWSRGVWGTGVWAHSSVLKRAVGHTGAKGSSGLVGQEPLGRWQGGGLGPWGGAEAAKEVPASHLGWTPCLSCPRAYQRRQPPTSCPSKPCPTCPSRGWTPHLCLLHCSHSRVSVPPALLGHSILCPRQGSYSMVEAGTASSVSHLVPWGKLPPPQCVPPTIPHPHPVQVVKMWSSDTRDKPPQPDPSPEQGGHPARQGLCPPSQLAYVLFGVSGMLLSWEEVSQASSRLPSHSWVVPRPGPPANPSATTKSKDPGSKCPEDTCAHSCARQSQATPQPPGSPGTVRSEETKGHPREEVNGRRPLQAPAAPQAIPSTGPQASLAPGFLMASARAAPGLAVGGRSPGSLAHPPGCGAHHT